RGGGYDRARLDALRVSQTRAGGDRGTAGGVDRDGRGGGTPARAGARRARPARQWRRGPGAVLDQRRAGRVGPRDLSAARARREGGEAAGAIDDGGAKPRRTRARSPAAGCERFARPAPRWRLAASD